MSDIVERLREGNGADWQTAEEAAAEVERLRRCLAKQPNTYMIAYEDGRHEQLARAACEMQDKLEECKAKNEKLLAALDKICNGQRDVDLSYLELFVEVKMEARAALEEKPNG